MVTQELVLGGIGLAAAVASWAMALFVYVAAPSRGQNRLVAVFLALVGFQVAGTFSLSVLVPSVVMGSEAVSMSAAISQSFVYLALVGTLATPLARPFRSAGAQRALLALAALSILAWPLYHRLILTPTEIAWGYFPILFLHGLALLYGVIVAISAWRRAPPGSATRARGRAFAYAFGIRDVVFFFFITSALVWWLGEYDPFSPFALRWNLAQNVLVPLSVVAMVLLMGYGMAKAHLFEVDLTIKRGVRRGAVAGAFLAVFLVASQLVEGL